MFGGATLLVTVNDAKSARARGARHDTRVRANAPFTLEATPRYAEIPVEVV